MHECVRGRGAGEAMLIERLANGGVFGLRAGSERAKRRVVVPLPLLKRRGSPTQTYFIIVRSCGCGCPATRHLLPMPSLLTLCLVSLNARPDPAPSPTQPGGMGLT